MLYCGGIAAATVIIGGSLCYHDRRVSSRLFKELPDLKAMHNDAATRAATASEETHFTVMNSEKEIFQRVCREIEWNIKQRERYFDSNFLRLLLPPPRSEEIMAYVLLKIAVDDDGDFYDSYLDFYARYSPNSAGSIVFQEIQKTQPQN